MILAAKSLDIDAFRTFLPGEGAKFDRPKPEAAEVLRFRIGNARGVITQAKDGRLSLGSIARPMFQKFEKHNREQRARQRAAEKEMTC